MQAGCLLVLLFATWLAGWPAPVHAQTAAPADRPMVVERPSFSTPPDLVGQHRWQIESGISWRRLSEDVDASPLVTTAPNLTLRVGVHPRLEWRVATSGVDWWTVDGRPSHAVANPSVGLKYHLLLERHSGVDLSVVPMLTLGWPHDQSPAASVVVTAARVMGPVGLNANLVVARDWSDRPAVERDQHAGGEVVRAHAQCLAAADRKHAAVGALHHQRALPAYFHVVGGGAAVEQRVQRAQRWVLAVGSERAPAR